MDKYFSFIFSPDIDWHDKDKNMLAGNSLIEQNPDWKHDLARFEILGKGMTN